MDHEPYKEHTTHGPWAVQGAGWYLFLMDHGLYKEYITHGPWAVQGTYHTLFNNFFPWTMDCTTDHIVQYSHWAWVVR